MQQTCGLRSLLVSRLRPCVFAVRDENFVGVTNFPPKKGLYIPDPFSHSQEVYSKLNTSPGEFQRLNGRDWVLGSIPTWLRPLRFLFCKIHFRFPNHLKEQRHHIPDSITFILGSLRWTCRVSTLRFDSGSILGMGTPLPGDALRALSFCCKRGIRSALSESCKRRPRSAVEPRLLE